jgi:CHAT domain-containing protein
MLGYNLYTDLDTAAEARKQFHLQVAVWSEALALIASDQDPLLRAMAHSWMAKSANSAGMPELAEREFNEANRSFAAAPQNESNRNDRIEVETLLAQLEVRQGDRQKAWERLGRIAPGIRLLSNHYIAIRYYAVLGALESGRGPGNDGERSLRSAVALAEQSLKSLRSDRDRSVWNEEVSEAYRSLVRTRLDQGEYQTALEIWEWYRGAALRSGSRSVLNEKTPPSLEAERGLNSSDLAEGPSLPALREVAQSLATLRSETVVSYGAFGDDFWIWTYDDRGVVAKKSSTSSIQIEALANRFVELCSNPESNVSALQRDARKLYELLVDPVRERLTGRIVIFEPDESLARVPMEALIDRSGNYLLDFGPFVLSPGLYFRSAAHGDAKISPQAEALVIVVSAPRAPRAYGLLPLPDAEREAEMVARSFTSGRLLRGSAATLDAIKTLLPSVSIFHFAGHAISSGDAAGLVVADTDFDRTPQLLDAAFLEGQRLDKMQVAVLSACATESAGIETYVAADDLGMAFLRSGVPHVVGSRWNVDSAGSAFLMQQFYASLFSGKSVSESIRRAQSEVRLRPEWAHPYFWASFEALGMP